MSSISLLDVVLQITNGSLRVPLKKAAAILGYADQTVRNQLSEGIFALKPIEPRKKGDRVYFLAVDIANLLESPPQPIKKPGRGRPRKSASLKLKQ